MSRQQISDAARRASDEVQQHIVDGNAGRWAAIRLSDGGSDGTAYPRRRDAVRHQLHPQQCAYLRIPRDSMPPAEAESFLATHRRLYAAGLQLTDPDSDRELIPPF